MHTLFFHLVCISWCVFSLCHSSWALSHHGETFEYQSYANWCILEEIVHCYYVIVVHVMMFPYSTIVQELKQRKSLLFFIFMHWYCDIRVCLVILCLNACFTSFLLMLNELVFVMYIPYTAGVTALYVVQGICIPKVDFMILCNLPIS